MQVQGQGITKKNKKTYQRAADEVMKPRVYSIKIKNHQIRDYECPIIKLGLIVFPKSAFWKGL